MQFHNILQLFSVGFGEGRDPWYSDEKSLLIYLARRTLTRQNGF
jgi:hypothetical protein